MQLFTFRVELIHNLDVVLEKTLVPHMNEMGIGVPITMVETICALESFLKNKVDLFDYASQNEKNEFIHHIVECHNLISVLAKKMQIKTYMVGKSETTVFLERESDIIRNLYSLILDRTISWSNNKTIKE